MTLEGQPKPEPVKPAHPSPLTFDQRVHLFGRFEFTHDPEPLNPEHVHINGVWVSSNIVSVEIPELIELKLGRHLSFHRRVAQQFVDLFRLWKERGLLQHVVSVDGSFATRFKRFNGSLPERLEKAKHATAINLSNHTFGSALDINARWNPLGQSGAPAGTKGSVHELIPTMEECGLASGEYFHGRIDPMHIEAVEARG